MMWYEEDLIRRKNQPFYIRFLLCIGFVKFGLECIGVDCFSKSVYVDYIQWPFHAPPKHQLKQPLQLIKWHWHSGFIYRFKNSPEVIKLLPGRLLPIRWGFGICGFEFGDRG